MDQEFALPLGEKEITIAEPAWGTSTDRPGIYGTFYYNGYPYQKNHLYFQKTEALDFKLDSAKHLDWVYRIDLNLKVENSFPAVSYLQVYFLNKNMQITDSLFVQGKQKTTAGEVNSLDEVERSATSIYDQISFEGQRLDRLKASSFLLYTVLISTSREDGATLRFTHQSRINVKMGMRLFLRYNVNDI
ncbi:MAG TPA: hypothetical protein VHO90_05555 [Bacteroidales bacterium]|nr:hypothetical protein [Bacteroidales bacterium]